MANTTKKTSANRIVHPQTKKLFQPQTMEVTVKRGQNSTEPDVDVTLEMSPDDPAVAMFVDFVEHRFDNPQTYDNTANGGKAGTSQLVLARDIGTMLRDLDPERFDDQDVRSAFGTALIELGLIQKAWAKKTPAYASLRYKPQQSSGLTAENRSFVDRYRIVKK